ncbi:hypothetical protein [Candidatus Palauibacter sp.]|uniref:hypothetical protein n=1 Tax=Candidatus Palauibacter sp. TaxID=3101350 RepID=UPI003B025447
MSERDPAGPGDDPHSERITSLSAAILRISQSLDPPTVLEDVVESARGLTGARLGVITTFDERGEVRDFVTSGLSPEERRAVVEWPDGLRVGAMDHEAEQLAVLRSMLARAREATREQAISEQAYRKGAPETTEAADPVGADGFRRVRGGSR